ncbi:PREDICTED: uncharacterized protein LOC105556908, partial [Vollenhovia emeryi]|uniref:uncharacterized protein LOC105556908 n=1 Tax=Vollenhovia emeryi TaxID=411798 RepID=UPI0005F3C7F5
MESNSSSWNSEERAFAFRQTASATRRRAGVPWPIRSPENIEAVRASILRSPRRSARKHASALGFSDRSVRRILHDDSNKTELWWHKLQWDDPLTSQLSTRWLIRREELIGLAKLSIPRWFNTWSTSSVELQGFSDASQLTMTAIVYISVHDSNGATISLVCSKTKVAPLKRLSIPRLELTAALLLSRLMQYVKATLNMDDFVRDRVAQTEELTPAAHWRYIHGTSNPADCASRGLTTAQLQNHSLWWTGPPWILKPDSWPSQPALSEELNATEARPDVSLLTVTPRTDYQWELTYRYSSLTKLLRITALCFRFVSRLRKVHDSLPVRHISPETLEKARVFWIQATQATYFSHELKALQADSPLAKAHAFNRLTAYIDAQGIIRVGGRLAHAASHLMRNTQHHCLVTLSYHHRSRSSTDSAWRHAAYDSQKGHRAHVPTPPPRG